MGRKRKYDSPPWLFKGRAIYQLHLIKLEEAKKYIPQHLKIVSVLGYTLGGFYLARYDDSPAGAFDECVALAGIVWDKPWSCAWAARVFVNNREARDHGRKHVGLPSRVCTLAKEHNVGRMADTTWWDQPLQAKDQDELHQSEKSNAPDACASSQLGSDAVIMRNVERRRPWRPWRASAAHEGLQQPVCAFSRFPSGYGRHGPMIKLKLPSFSGCTPDNPVMLHYTCLLSTNIRPIKPLNVSLPAQDHNHHQSESLEKLDTILGGRPVVTLAFDNMEMLVHNPKPVQLLSDMDTEFE